MITARVAQNITITGLDFAYAQAIKKHFAIPNMAYAVAVKRRISTRFIAENIYYIDVDKAGRLIAPRGLEQYLSTLFKDCVWEYEVYEKDVDLSSRSVIELRPYQTPIVDKVVDTLLLSRKNHQSTGLIEMGTGTGKTITSLAIAARLGIRTAVLVPNNVLLNQWADEVRKFLRIEPGIINGKHKSIGPITIVTWQSANRHGFLSESLFSGTGLLIVDEANCVTAKVRRNILTKFNPKYILGLTATPDRSDGQGMGVRYILGHTLAKYVETELKPKVDIVFSHTPIAFDVDYHKMIDTMIANESRNTLIQGLIFGELLQKRKILVLTKRIEHYETLFALFPDFVGFFYVDSGDNGRTKLLEQFKSGVQNFNCIFGTTSLLGVGMDIPALDTIIIACDVKSTVLTTQMVGRILRIFKGKPTPKIIDIADGACYYKGCRERHANPVFTNQFKARKNLYIEKGWLEEPTYVNSGKAKRIW